MKSVTHVVAVAAAFLASAAAAQDKIELNTITKVQVSGGSITITGTRKPSFSTFTMTDPARLVIDITEAVFSGVPDEQQVGNGVVTAIKTASYGSDASAIARVLIGFEKEYETDIQSTDTKLVVKVLGAGGGGEAVAMATPPPNQGSAGTAGTGTTGQAAADKAAAEKAAADKAASDKAAADKAAAAQAAADKATAEKTAKEQAEAERKSEAERKKQEAEAAKVAAAEEKKRKEEEAAAAREQKKQEAEAAKVAAAEEKKRKEEEAAAAREQKKQEQEAAKLAAVEEKRRKEGEAAATREQKRQEQEEAKQAALEEKKQKEEEAAAAREQKKQEAEAAKQATAEEKKRKADEAAAAREQKQQEAEEARLATAEEKKRKAEEAAAERERKRQEAEVARQERVAMADTAPRASGSDASTSSDISVSSRQKTMTFLGFKQESGAQRVYVRTNEPVRYSLQRGGDKAVVLELENTSIALNNNTRFLDTSYFNGAVAMVQPQRGSTRTVRIEIKLKENVPYEAKQEGNEVYVDFRR